MLGILYGLPAAQPPRPEGQRFLGNRHNCVHDSAGPRFNPPWNGTEGKGRARQAIRDPCGFTPSDTNTTFCSGHKGSPGPPPGRAYATYFTRRTNVANGPRANLRVLVNALLDGNPWVSALNGGVCAHLDKKTCPHPHYLEIGS